MAFRLIARLDIKGANLVKGIHLEGLRVIGSPRHFAQRYSRAGWEILYIDIVASLYGRNQLEGLLRETADSTHVPIAVGGGIAGIAEATRLFNAGADKVAVNTATLKRPDLIGEIAGRFGSQAIVVSVEAVGNGSGWECTYNCGRDRAHRDARQWVSEAVDRGAGEILLTSVDMEGTRRGFDLKLIEAIARSTPVPVIACGGCGTLEHIRQAREAGADGVALASVLHYNVLTQEEIEHGYSEGVIQAEGSGSGRASEAGPDCRV